MLGFWVMSGLGYSPHWFSGFQRPDFITNKGYKNVIIRRDFADFLMYHPVAESVKEFFKDAAIPDEHVYATLGRIEQIVERKNSRYLVLLSTYYSYIHVLTALYQFTCFSKTLPRD